MLILGFWLLVTLAKQESDSCEDAIMMEPAEIDVVKAFLHPGVVMFEFGSGVPPKKSISFAARWVDDRFRTAGEEAVRRGTCPKLGCRGA